VSKPVIFHDFVILSTKRFVVYVSLAIMSHVTAKVKCPHYGRQSEFEAKAVEKVVSSPNGVGGASLIERGKCSDAGLLLAC